LNYEPFLLRLPDSNAADAGGTTTGIASLWPASKAYETFELAITPNRIDVGLNRFELLTLNV
jgi:hypothetical protein